MIVWDFNFSIEILELSIEILVGQPEAYKLSSLSCFDFSDLSMETLVIQACFSKIKA